MNLPNHSQQKRHQARQHALQALYQWSFNPVSSTQLIQDFLAEHPADAPDMDKEYFEEIVSGTVAHIEAIDKQMSAHLDRPIRNLNPVELAVLRLAIYELGHRPDIPYKVVIDEALELAKEFGSQEGHKYVNGVLDAVRVEIR